MPDRDRDQRDRDEKAALDHVDAAGANVSAHEVDAPVPSRMTRQRGRTT